MNDKNIIMLFDEERHPVKMAVIATLQLNNNEYAILHAIAQDEDYICQVNSLGDQQEFTLVTDEAKCQEIIDAYYEFCEDN